MRTNLPAPTPQGDEPHAGRRDAADEAIGALAIEGSSSGMTAAARRALETWTLGTMDNATLIARMDHLRRLAPPDDSGAGCLAARYAVALTRPLDLPASFVTLRALHRSLFEWRDNEAGTPRTVALPVDEGVQRSPDLVSNRDPSRIPTLEAFAFRFIHRGAKLVGRSGADFVGLAAEFAADILILAPFGYGNGITLRLLLTLLGHAAGHPLAFRGATRARVLDAFSSALHGDPASLIQLLDACLRPPAFGDASTLPSIRDILLSNGDVQRFVAALAKRHAITGEHAPIDAFATAVSRLSDAEVRPDPTQDLLTALGRAGVLDGHDVTMLLAAHLRQQG